MRHAAPESRADDDADSSVDDNEIAPPSKSQRKRDSDALQRLGKTLIALSTERLAKIEMSDALRIALREAQRLTKNEAKRRQLQYIGRLMRDEDPTPIRAALDEIAGISTVANERMHRLERLRLLLLDDESAALDEITSAYPNATHSARTDLQQLRQLRRNALKEKDQNKPPRAFREIFQILKALDEAEDNHA